MRITASGGTDGASLVLFWPDNLPENFDRDFDDDPVQQVEDLRDQGKLVWFPCDGDGHYTLAVFVNAALPDSLRELCESGENMPSLEVAGEGYFGGMEYMFEADRALLDRYPHMAGQVAIPPGRYAAVVYRADEPEDDVLGEWLVERAGTKAKRLSDLHSTAAALAIVGVLASLISVAFVSWPVWLAILAATIAATAAAIALSRTAGFQAVKKAEAEFEREFPDYVLELTELR